MCPVFYFDSSTPSLPFLKNSNSECKSSTIRQVLWETRRSVSGTCALRNATIKKTLRLYFLLFFLADRKESWRAIFQASPSHFCPAVSVFTFELKEDLTSTSRPPSHTKRKAMEVKGALGRVCHTEPIHKHPNETDQEAICKPDPLLLMDSHPRC